MVKKAKSEPRAEEKVEGETPPLSEAEYERRTKLCVSHIDYINPSLDRK